MWFIINYKLEKFHLVVLSKQVNFTVDSNEWSVQIVIKHKINGMQNQIAFDLATFNLSKKLMPSQMHKERYILFSVLKIPFAIYSEHQVGII